MSDKIITLKQKDTGDRCLPKTVKEAILDLEIDQIFDGESTNPQSGVAIQQVLDNLPSINNGVLTIQKNGTNIAAFSANSSIDVLANITVPTKTSDLTNDDNFIKNTSTDENSLQIESYQLLDTSTGLIPDARLSSSIARASQIVKSDWNASSGGAEILNKPDLTVYETKQKTINTPSTSGTITLTDNSINSITPSGNITFTLPTVADNTVFHEIMVQLNLSTVYTVDVGTTYYFNKTAPDLSTAGTYNLYYEYDKASQQWYCGALSKGTVS